MRSTLVTLKLPIPRVQPLPSKLSRWVLGSRLNALPSNCFRQRRKRLPPLALTVTKETRRRKKGSIPHPGKARKEAARLDSAVSEGGLDDTLKSDPFLPTRSTL